MKRRSHYKGHVNPFSSVQVHKKREKEREAVINAIINPLTQLKSTVIWEKPNRNLAIPLQYVIFMKASVLIRYIQ